MNKPYYKYAVDVVEGKVVCCENIKLACKRFLSDLEREDLEFREDAVDNAISFIGILNHFAGKSSGQPFILEPWQQFIVANIIGFYWKDGDRRFTSSYIEVSRKNGKTALAAALCMYFLIADGEDGAEVDLAANSKDQASIAFNFCSNFAKQLDPSAKALKAYRDSILLDVNDSKLKVFAADDSKLDGFNASFGLVDEYHSAKNSKVRDVIKSSMGMRQNPHLLNGLKEDDSMFIAIYSLDDEDDWTDENNWVKCTPNLDVTVTKKYIKEQVKSAINNPSEEVGVKTKTLNLWCDSASVWLPESYIVRNTKKINLEEFRGCPCYIGVDLGATSDLTAVSYLVEKDGIYYFKTDYYLPESALKEKPDRETYKYWKQMGLLKVTEGNVTDYDYITNDMIKASEIVNIQAIGYDKYNATQWAIHSTELGLPLEEYPQTLGNFNKPTREMERLILSGKAVIDNNEINRWCFKNVTLKSDHNGNVKPNKDIKAKKIDGVIAMIQALGMYLLVPHYSNEILII